MGLFSAIGGIVGGAVGGPVGSAIGGAIGAGLDGSGASSDADAASGAAAGARAETLRSAQEGVDIAIDFLDDFEAIYGGIEDNLGSFFSQLTPEVYVATGLENLQQEFQQTKTRVNEQFAQRFQGQETGLQLSLDTLLEATRATERANIRTEAPFKVAEAQSKFLALGLPQKSNAQANILNQINARTNALAGFATGATNAAANAAESAGILEGEFGAALGKAGEAIFNEFDFGDFIS